MSTRYFLRYQTATGGRVIEFPDEASAIAGLLRDISYYAAHNGAVVEAIDSDDALHRRETRFIVHYSDLEEAADD